jgi:hypothetical protein
VYDFESAKEIDNEVSKVFHGFAKKEEFTLYPSTLGGFITCCLIKTLQSINAVNKIGRWFIK